MKYKSLIYILSNLNLLQASFFTSFLWFMCRIAVNLRNFKVPMDIWKENWPPFAARKCNRKSKNNGCTCILFAYCVFSFCHQSGIMLSINTWYAKQNIKLYNKSETGFRDANFNYRFFFHFGSALHPTTVIIYHSKAFN